MKKFLITVMAVAAMTASAQAGTLNFDFSFTNTFGNTGGTVTGEIFGLTNNATSAASAVDIYSVPAGYVVYGETLPFNTMTAANVSISLNSFTVVNDAITDAEFSAGVDQPFPGPDWLLMLETDNYYDMGSIEVGKNGLQVQTFNAKFTLETATTPLPAALPLFASGFGALGLLGWRRKRKAILAASEQSC